MGERLRPASNRIPNMRNIPKPYSFDNPAQREMGRNNERRARELLESLVEEGFISKVTSPTKKQRKEGVNLIVHKTLGTETVAIPFQVTSSVNGAASFRKRVEARGTQIGILSLVVNDFKTDTEIKRVIIGKVGYFLTRVQEKHAEVAEVVNALV